MTRSAEKESAPKLENCFFLLRLCIMPQINALTEIENQIHNISRFKFINISYVHLTVVWKPVDLKYSKMMVITKEKKKDLKDLTELLPVSAANYYDNLLENLENIQTDKRNDNSSDEDDLMNYTTQKQYN